MPVFCDLPNGSTVAGSTWAICNAASRVFSSTDLCSVNEVLGLIFEITNLRSARCAGPIVDCNFVLLLVIIFPNLVVSTRRRCWIATRKNKRTEVQHSFLV